MNGEDYRHPRRIVVLILLSAVAPACVARNRKPPEAMAARLRTIAVVPIEAPPLLMHPKTESDRAAIEAAGLCSPSGSSLKTYIFLGALTGAVVGTAPLAIGAASYLAVTSAPRSGDAVIVARDRPPGWMPTVRLARLAAERLRQGERESFEVDGYGRLPITDRSVNEMLENWMAPIRRWYNDDKAVSGWEPRDAPRPDGVLEVGVSNFEYWDKQLLLQVNVKLSDGTSGRVLGRARNAAWPTGGPLSEVLREQASPLQRLVESTGDELLIRCLNDLGLSS